MNLDSWKTRMAKDKCKTRPLTIPEKIEIIKEVDKGERKKKDIAFMFSIPATTLSAILKDRDYVVKEYTRIMHEAGHTWYQYPPSMHHRPDHQCHKSSVAASRTIPCVPIFKKLTLYKPVSGQLQKSEFHCLDLRKPTPAVTKRRYSSDSETSESKVASPRCSEEGYASTSGTSRGQTYEDHLAILPNAEEDDGLVCEPEEFEEKYQPPVEYYESQAGTSETSKRGHEMEENENANRKRKGRDVMLSDEMLQEEMIPEEVTVTPSIPTTLIDSSSSNSSTTRLMAVPASPASGRASPEVVATSYQQPNGVQQRPPVCDSPVFLKQTNITQAASTPSEAATNGSSDPKKQHPRLFPYALPTPRVLNVDEQYLDAEERRLVLELERRRLNLEEKRLQIEESEKNRRYCLDEKRLLMEEEDRRRTRMNEKKRLELEERRVALMEKKAEPEMKHWKMMDNFMNDALKILSQIITAVGKLQGVPKIDDLTKQQTLLEEVSEQSKSQEQSLPDVSETSPKRRKRKRRRSSNSDDVPSSEESGSESETPKFSEKETTVLLKEVEEKQSVLLSTSSDSETVAKKKSTWTAVAERVRGCGGVERTAEDVRNMWLSLRRKSRRKCQKISTAPVNLTATERTVIRILSADDPQVKFKS